ncbi:MAG TPA: hypothetical protein PKW55_01550 [Spirochaetota bacterium]|nr:hypothetical protein [Spirochaetota bacterium]HOM38902.1 hypothetical protein [Spirochaetota bacterium]HPQ49119.1 hypothetical protein [Spirochaetota bacterium]
MKKIFFLVVIVFIFIFIYLSFFIVPKGMIYYFDSKMRGKDIYFEKSILFCPELVFGLGNITKIPEINKISKIIILPLPYIENTFISEHYKVEVFYEAKIFIKKFFNLLYNKTLDELMKEIQDNITLKMKEVLSKNSSNISFNQESFLSELSSLNNDSMQVEFKILYFPDWPSYISLVNALNSWLKNDAKKVIIEGLEKKYRTKIDIENRIDAFDSYVRKAEEFNKKVDNIKLDRDLIFNILKFLYKEER